MDCNVQQTEFLRDIETSIGNTTPAVRYICESDMLIFAIPNLINKIAILKEKGIYLCDLQGNCLTAGNTPQESVKLFKEFVANLLTNKRI